MSLTDSSPLEIAQLAAVGARQLAVLSNDARNDALVAIHDALAKNKDVILEANAKDVQAAGQAVKKGELSQSILKRLDLTRPGKYEDMLKGILDVKVLPDPSKFWTCQFCFVTASRAALMECLLYGSWKYLHAHIVG